MGSESITVLFTDDTALVADSEKLSNLVKECGRSCEKEAKDKYGEN